MARTKSNFELAHGKLILKTSIKWQTLQVNYYYQTGQVSDCFIVQLILRSFVGFSCNALIQSLFYLNEVATKTVLNRLSLSMKAVRSIVTTYCKKFASKVLRKAFRKIDSEVEYVKNPYNDDLGPNCVKHLILEKNSGVTTLDFISSCTVTLTLKINPIKLLQSRKNQRWEKPQ